MMAKIAIVHDALGFYGGSELVVEAMLEVFPQAELFSLTYNRMNFVHTPLAGRKVTTSFVDKLPFGRTKYRSYLPILPLAIESLDVRGYDLILSSHYAVAHGVIVRPDQLHISYTHTPLRYAWHQAHEFKQTWRKRGWLGRWSLRSWLGGLVLHYFRLWDYAAAQRVDHILANSQWIARNIWRAYRREAQVIYPPVDIERFHPASQRDGYYVSLARLEHHKRVDLVIDAFTRLGLALKVVGDGQERRRLAVRAGPNVQFLGRLSVAAVAELLSRARGLVMANEEDFGIVAVEAQAAGCPVIAYGKGGALETVIEGQTGVYFHSQTLEDLVETIQAFERAGGKYDPEAMQRNTARFSKQRFLKELEAFVFRVWEKKL